MKLRAKHRILVGPHVYEPRALFTCDPKTADWLVGENHAEVA